jgi:hypothetical protein
VDSVFAVRTDFVPEEMHVSPRLGFSYMYGRRKFGMPRGKFYGGLGEFRGAISPEFVAESFDQTGLPGAKRVLWCSGAAAPMPAWSTFLTDPSAIPAECATGYENTVFSASQPSILVFDRSYVSPRRWSATFGWEPSAIGTNRFSASVEYARTLHSGSQTDLNFTDAPRFQLAGEGGRPVFVSSGNIESGTGAIGLGETRRVDGFGRVISRVSDLDGTALQLRTSMYGYSPAGGGEMVVEYAFTRATVASRGIGASTAGSPLAIERSIASQPIHDISGRYSRSWGETQGHRMRRNYIVAVFRVSSGAAFTPTVAGDVNGDGYWNDRAFIFDPATVADPTLSHDFSSLLSSGSASRSCLASQLGRVAGANSCRGPWSFTIDGEYTRSYPVGDRSVRFTLSAQNVVGGFDRLLHGASGLRGWGDIPMPDPVLLSVTGFDPVAQRFTYSVNPKFGRARQNGFHRPFRVQLGVNFAFMQQSDPRAMSWRALGLDKRGGGKILPLDSVRARMAGLWFRNQAAELIASRDSLYLVDEQVTALVPIAREIAHAVDSLTLLYGMELLARGPNTVMDSVFTQLSGTSDYYEFHRAWALRWAPRILEIISPEQLELVPVLLWHRQLVEQEKERKAKLEKAARQQTPEKRRHP